MSHSISFLIMWCTLYLMDSSVEKWRENKSLDSLFWHWKLSERRGFKINVHPLKEDVKIHRPLQSLRNAGSHKIVEDELFVKGGKMRRYLQSLFWFKKDC